MHTDGAPPHLMMVRRHVHLSRPRVVEEGEGDTSEVAPEKGPFAVGKR